MATADTRQWFLNIAAQLTAAMKKIIYNAILRQHKNAVSASFRHIYCLALFGSAKSKFLGGVDDVVADEGAGEGRAAD